MEVVPKKVHFNDQVSMYFVPRKDDSRICRWISYCPHKKYCINKSTYLSYCNGMLVNRCYGCGHIRD